MGLLFSTIGIAASDFFCINLSTIANILGMSESMAGVTFLAFGNGSPDVFSTFAAMSTNSGSLAVGELIGAASFITAVVAGSMALVRPFRVARKSFVRDVGFFVVAASFSMIFLADGHLHLWESTVMVAFYVFYVITVVIWHWYLGRYRRKRAGEAMARETFLAPGEEEPPLAGENDDQVGSAYRARSSSRRTTLDDFVALERGGNSMDGELDEDADDGSRDRWMAEISRNMRVRRPSSKERRNTANPIRPSLVGAMEFRAVLSSLTRSRNQQGVALDVRRHSEDPVFTLAQEQQTAVVGSESSIQRPWKDTHHIVPNDSIRPVINGHRANRTRAVSANDAVGLSLNNNQIHISPVPQIDLLGLSPQSSAEQQAFVYPWKDSNGIDTDASEIETGLTGSLHSGTAQTLLSKTSSSPERSVSYLALPSKQRESFSSGDQISASRQSRYPISSSLSPRPCIERQSLNGSTAFLSNTAASSPAMPFPPYHDDPDRSMSSRSPSLRLPAPSIGPKSAFSQPESYVAFHKSFSWWPYNILPLPTVLASTLFPTIYSWNEKSITEKAMGVIAAPSVFLLAITLPVVELAEDDENPEYSKTDIDHRNSSWNVSQEVSNTHMRSSSNYANIEPVDDTLGFRDLLMPHGAQLQHNTKTPKVYTSDGDDTSTPYTDIWIDYGPDLTSSPDAHSQMKDPLAMATTETPNPRPPSPKDWNRWLVCIQIFTAPFFVVLIFWANTDPDLAARNLLLPTLYTMIGSLVFLALVLLITTEAEPPRYRFLLCFVGFVVSIAWISTIANEVVGVLKAFGVILGITDAILGLTIFAVGNSLGDLVADITVARLGYPVMALSACFGGPMLNILLGIGLSGVYMTIRDGNRKHVRHPGRPVIYKPYQVEVGGTLVISGITLLITLLGLLVVVPLNNWVMDRRIGWALVALWCISTVVNLTVEVFGWSDSLSFF